MRIIIVLIATVLAACASHGEIRELSAKELSAVQSAEEFIARHGYTAAGHPANLPVINVEVLDPLVSRENLIKERYDTMEPKAFGIAKAAPSASWVLFHYPRNPDEIRAVLVKETTAVQVVHSRLTLEELDWIKIPGR